MTRLRDAAGRIIVGLWFASASTLIFRQVREIAHPAPYPQVPGDDPSALVAVVDGCRRHLGPRDRLGVAYPEGRGIESLYVVFRLSYVLYPISVASYSYAEGGFPAAAALARAARPTCLLLVGPSPVELPGATPLARFGERGAFFRLEPEGR